MPGEERGKRFVSKQPWYVKRRPFATLHKNLTSVDASSSQSETDRGNWRGVVGVSILWWGSQFFLSSWNTYMTLAGGGPMVVMGRSQLKLFCISFFGGGVFML
jgi:hypothetical protein